MNKALTKIIRAFALEGGLYGVQGEDCTLQVFDTQIGVDTVDGRRLYHRAFVVPGAVRGDEGFYFPNFNYRHAAARFIAKVAERGEIDETNWDVLPEPESLEVQWTADAHREQQERAGFSCSA